MRLRKLVLVLALQRFESQFRFVLLSFLKFVQQFAVRFEFVHAEQFKLVIVFFLFEFL